MIPARAPDFEERKKDAELVQKALRCIAVERECQDRKWGRDRRLPLALWLAVLGEEFGEVARVVCEHTTTTGELELDWATRIHLETELIQVAAVATAWLEHSFRVREEEKGS